METQIKAAAAVGGTPFPKGSLQECVRLMPKKILFLYKGLPQKIDQLKRDNIQGVFIGRGKRLVGIELGTVSDQLRRQLVSDYALREFEVEQHKFKTIINKLPSYGAKITKIEVRKSELLDEELIYELEEAISEQNIEKINGLIDIFWEYGHDIESLEFYCNGERIRYTWLAELDYSANEVDVNKILNTYPIGVLSGVVREECK